ncbi:hypothetical protein GCM10027160_23330 [Streptomyces calidiresistens]|uniref:Terminase n=1 Tax=Streptomyces calidiresistens TaxID=1485586 RepID=A0A7W3T4W8_9ACTN|nr:hypothetical protein [Streptomyces calidiresistens]MBB0230984.1 hypothetical protein [Streptomyces calidiresistens]
MARYLHDPGTGEPWNGETFDHEAYLGGLIAEFGRAAFTSPEARRELTRYDPLLFALLYLPQLLRDKHGTISWADTHLEFARLALRWTRPAGLHEERHAYIAPRGSAKSTWLFKLLPIWALAHDHAAARFIAAFSSAGAQAQRHLTAVRLILASNELLRTDYPDLCRPAQLSSRSTVANTQHMYHAASRVTFSALGLDGEILGLVDPLNRRPSLLILDDPEPSGEVYSLYQRDKRLRTIVDAVLAMSEDAHVVWAGTTTMADGLADQLVKHSERGDQDWVRDEKFQVHYFHPLPHRPDGSRRSIWPAKWPAHWLEEQEARGSVSYAKNFENKPRPTDGIWWRPRDIQRLEASDVPETHRRAMVRTVLTIDPAVTTTGKSDFTGFAVTSLLPGDERHAGGRALVRYACGRKLPHGEPMRAFVLALLQQFPEVCEIVIETNQGGGLHEVALYGMPVPIETEHTTESKTVRFASLLQRCQVGQVLFDGRIAEFEDQALAYPEVGNDDVIDAVCQGVDALLTDIFDFDIG